VQGKPPGRSRASTSATDQAQARASPTSPPPLIKANTGPRYNRTCIFMNKSLQASRFLHKEDKQQQRITHHQTLLLSATLRRFWGGFSSQTYREMLYIIFIGRFS
jgi:hypothetical protein